MVPYTTLRPSVHQSQSGWVVQASAQRAFRLERWLPRPPLLGSFPEMTSEAAAISCSPYGPVGCVGKASCGPSGLGSTEANAEGAARSGQWRAKPTLSSGMDSSPGRSRPLVSRCSRAVGSGLSSSPAIPSHTVSSSDSNSLLPTCVLTACEVAPGAHSRTDPLSHQPLHRQETEAD